MSDAAQFGMKPVTLELGGKSPQVVFDDAGDIDELAARILRGFTANGGQACVAGTRLIVQRGIADALTEKLIALCRTFRPGLTWDENTRYAPMIDARRGNKVAAVVAAASGWRRGSGGWERFADTGDGWFWQPTLLTGMAADNPAIQTEIFGPVLTIQRFDEEEGRCAWRLTIPTACAPESIPLTYRGRCARFGSGGRHRLGEPLWTFGRFHYSHRWIPRVRYRKRSWPAGFPACQQQKSVLIDF